MNHRPIVLDSPGTGRLADPEAGQDRLHQNAPSNVSTGRDVFLRSHRAQGREFATNSYNGASKLLEPPLPTALRAIPINQG